MKGSDNIILFLLLIKVSYMLCDLADGEACALKPNSPINNGLPGTCINFHKCLKIKQLWKDKAITRDQLTICNRAGKIICCPSEERISQKKCKEYGENGYHITRVGSLLLGHKPREIKTSKCTHKSVSLIVGGNEAGHHEFPHQALLGYSPRNTEFKWLCGGSLVSPKFVMTAAHCLFERQNGHVKKVKLGMQYIDDPHDNKNVFIYNIKKKFKHPNYNNQTFNEDIALLELDGHVPLNQNILPICLPTKQHDNLRAIATGFGKTRTEQQSDVLLKVILESFTHSECQDSWPDDGVVQINEKTMMCFGHHTERKDTCRGDSGGPIQISNDDNVHCTYTQIGISSFGPNRCGTIRLPSGYTNVYNYLDWIEGIVWGNEI